MFFFCKRKEIILDAYTCRPDVFKYTPIASAKSHRPRWVSALPTHIESGLDQHPTIKRCPGLNDYFSKGFIIPMWSDLRVRATGEGLSYQFADLMSSCGFHRKELSAGYMTRGNYEHCQIQTPWALRCNKNIDFLFSKVEWYFDQLGKVYIPSGIVRYVHQSAATINAFFPANGEIIQISHGQPLMHVLPLSDKKVTLKTHLVTKPEFDRIAMESRPCAFANSFLKREKLGAKIQNKV